MPEEEWPAPAAETAQMKAVHGSCLHPSVSLGRETASSSSSPSPPCDLPGSAPQSYFSMLSMPGVRLGGTSHLQLRAGSPWNSWWEYHQDVEGLEAGLLLKGLK